MISDQNGVLHVESSDRRDHAGSEGGPVKGEIGNEEIPVPVTAEVTLDDEGRTILAVDADPSMVWLHSFEKHPDNHEEAP